MLKFSANLSMLFNEAGFMERFHAASEACFKGVEYLFPYEWDKDELAEKLQDHNLEQVLFNLPAGNWAAGERGIACLPARREEFQEGVGSAIQYARSLKCSRVNCLVGLTPSGVPDDRVFRTVVENLRFAAKVLEKEGITLLVEALNNQDIPGFYLAHTRDALELIREVNCANLKLQYDIYHMQIMEGNLMKTIGDNLPLIAHIQLADNPGRHEPGTGEINFGNLLPFIDEAGYEGWIGCEYKPAGETKDGLGWLSSYVARGGD